MAKKRYKPDEIVSLLRQAEVLLTCPRRLVQFELPHIFLRCLDMTAGGAVGSRCCAAGPPFAVGGRFASSRFRFAGPSVSRSHISLVMRLGLEHTSGRSYGRWVQSRNWVRFALSRPFADEPGRRMNTQLACDWLAGPLSIR